MPVTHPDPGTHQPLVAGDLVRPSISRARDRAIWVDGQIPSAFIAWSASPTSVDPESAQSPARVGGNDRGQVRVPWDAVGLVVAVRNPGASGASLMVAVQFPDAVVLCAAGRLERVGT